MTDDFAGLLRDLIVQFGGTGADLASAVHVAPTTLSNLLNRRVGVYPSLELCIRLAHVTGYSLAKILRVAGKGTIADQLEDVWGPPRHREFVGERLTPSERAHLTAIRQMTPKGARMILTLVEAFAQADGRAPTLPFSQTKQRVAATTRALRRPAGVAK